MNSILIVEDEVRIASFIEKGLRKKGFYTAIALDGEQALLMIKEYEFDLLLLDLGLPVKDGLAVLEELRHQEINIPVIIVTACDEVHANVVGFDYIIKPFQFRDLLELIYRYLPSSG